MKIERAEFLRSSPTAADLLPVESPEVAFVGRSNVGKSSLLNRLLGQRGLARTSGTPGRTQAVNYFRIDDGRLLFVDLPGYGFARASRAARGDWAKVIEAYLARSPERRLLVQLVDARVGATELDVEASRYLAATGSRRVIAATKIDKLGRGERARALAEIGRHLELDRATEILPVSAVTGEGMRELWKHVSEHSERAAELSAGEIPPQSKR